jgi:hypothetical protein
MKHLAYWTGLRIFRDRKIRVFLLLFFIFFASFSLIYRQQNLTFPYYEMDEKYQDEQQIYRLIPQAHFEGELGQEVQRRLGSNSTSIGTQRYLLAAQDGNDFGSIELLPSYTEVGTDLVENNLFLHEATAFESHDLLVNDYLPPIEEVKEEGRFFEALESSGLDVEWNYFSASQVIKAEVELIAGFFLFFFIALLANDHFTKDHEHHWSVTYGVPKVWKNEWRLRSLYLFGLFWLVTLGGLAVSYLIGAIIDAPGSLNYPSAIYLESGVHYFPMWQYFMVVILLAMLLSYLLLLLTTGLSWFIRNSYLTILLVSGLFIVPQIWQYIPAFSSWQPSLYLNLLGVISGTTAQSTGLSGVVWWKAGIIYLALIIVLEIIFEFIFSKIPTETTGLKRRVLT